MYGRFSVHSTNLIKSVKEGLERLNFKPLIKYSPDGRCKIRIQNKKDIIKFFSIIGTSNLKHIVRFLLWRIKRYEARIEVEGLKNLVQMVNELIKIDIKNVSN